jgi:hypothetical protein
MDLSELGRARFALWASRGVVKFEAVDDKGPLLARLGGMLMWRKYR